MCSCMGIAGFGPNVAQLDGETEKVQFEKVRNSLSRWETAWFRGLKGRDIPAQGQRPGNKVTKIVEPCKGVT
jgi:hypothetical protein